MKNTFPPEDFSRRITKSLDALMQRQQSEIQESFAKIAENYRLSIDRAIRPFLERVEQLAQEAEAASTDLAGPLQAAGFWIPPSASLTFIRELRDLCVAGNASPSEVRSFFVAHYQTDDHALLRSAIQSWNRKSHFDIRIHMIRSALDAHMSGDFVLSIPVLLPVIEGVLTGIAGRSRQPWERMSDFAEGILTEEYYEGMKEASKDAIIEFITGSTFYGVVPREYFSVDRFSDWLEQSGLGEGQILNRHAILHGIQLNYSSAENSLRAFLILDSLSFIEPLKILRDRNQ